LAYYCNEITDAEVSVELAAGMISGFRREVRSTLFWGVTQLWLLVAEYSGRPLGLYFNVHPLKDKTDGLSRASGTNCQLTKGNIAGEQSPQLGSSLFRILPIL
jgi:hypothetical protein